MNNSSKKVFVKNREMAFKLASGCPIKSVKTHYLCCSECGDAYGHTVGYIVNLPWGETPKGLKKKGIMVSSTYDAWPIKPTYVVKGLSPHAYFGDIEVYQWLDEDGSTIFQWESEIVENAIVCGEKKLMSNDDILFFNSKVYRGY